MKHLLTFLLIGGFSFFLSAQSNITFTSSCEFTTVCNPSNNCGDIIPDLVATATTDCSNGNNLVFSYQLDINNDGNVNLAGSGASVNDLLSQGEHRVIFTATDQCNTSATCEFVFEIIDCNKPTPICSFGISTVHMPNTGIVEISAASFNAASYDDCSDNNDLIFSFSEDINDITKTITCADLSTTGLMTIDIFVTDEAGNFDFCTNYISIYDPSNVCNLSPSPSSGIISATTPNGENFENVSWDINGVVSPFPPTSVNVGDVITPIANSYNVLNGVTTFDLILISKHILNINSFTQSWQWEAADVNNTLTITTLDLVKIRSVILQQATQFQVGQSWGFIPSSIVVDNNFTAFEFLTFHYGDVNSTALPMLLTSQNVDTRTGNSTLSFSTKNKNLIAGKTYTFPIAAQNFEAIIGGQFTLEFDTEALDFQNIETVSFEDLTIENFGLSQVDEGLVLCSWNSSEGKNWDANTPFYNITFTAKKDGQLSDFLQLNSTQIAAEAYEENGNSLDILNIELNFEAGEKSEVVNISPNPFSEKTTLNFYLEKASDVRFEIFDVSGRTVFSQQKYTHQGENQIEISKEDFPQNGIYFYQLHTDFNIITGKLIMQDN